MINKELLLETLQYIEEHPEKWNQKHWVPECGTACCFAGRAALLAGATYPLWMRNAGRTATMVLPYGAIVSVSDYAAGKLGIDSKDADKLFDAKNTLEDLNLVVKQLIEES